MISRTYQTKQRASLQPYPTLVTVTTNLLNITFNGNKQNVRQEFSYMPDDSVTQVISSISNMFIESSELSPFFASYIFKTEQHKANVQTEYKVVYFLFYFLKPWKSTCAKGTHTEHLFEITPPTHLKQCTMNSICPLKCK